MSTVSRELPEPFNFKKLLGFTSFFQGFGSVRKPNLPGLGVKIRSENGQLNGPGAIKKNVDRGFYITYNFACPVRRVDARIVIWNI